MQHSHPDARVPDRYGHRYARPVTFTPFARRSLAVALAIWLVLFVPFVLAAAIR